MEIGGKDYSGNLMEVLEEAGDLVLIIDTNGRPGWVLDRVPVVTLRLRGWFGGQEVPNSLRDAVGAPVLCWYEGEGQETTTVFLEIGYDDTTCELTCRTVEVTEAEYSVDQLWSKLEELNAEYTDLSKSLRDAERKHALFVREARGETAKELDRCLRKIEFFRTTNPVKAAEIEGHARVWRRVLAILDHLSKPPADNA